MQVKSLIVAAIALSASCLVGGSRAAADASTGVFVVCGYNTTVTGTSHCATMSSIISAAADSNNPETILMEPGD